MINIYKRHFIIFLGGDLFFYYERYFKANIKVRVECRMTLDEFCLLLPSKADYFSERPFIKIQIIHGGFVGVFVQTTFINCCILPEDSNL